MTELLSTFLQPETGLRWEMRVRTGVSTRQSSGLSPHSLLSNLQHQLLLTRLWHQRPLQTRKGADSQVSGGGYCKDDLTDLTESLSGTEEWCSLSGQTAEAGGQFLCAMKNMTLRTVSVDS